MPVDVLGLVTSKMGVVSRYCTFVLFAAFVGSRIELVRLS
jgi:hypothetical protein